MKKTMTKRISALMMAVSMCAALALPVSAYHFRGYFSRNVGYGNGPAYSDYIYKVKSQGKWALECTSNSQKSSMSYNMVNSNNENRGTGKTSSSTFSVVELNSSGEAGYKYKLKVAKTSSNPLKAYTIVANWDTDANK